MEMESLNVGLEPSVKIGVALIFVLVLISIIIGAMK